MATTLNTRMGTLTPTSTYGAIKTLSSFASPKKSKRSAKTNNGSGIKYLGHKLGLGFLSSVEGIWDYTAGGAAKLFGETFDSDSAVKWAEKQFDKDWTNYNAADEWYNPSEGWRFAGDIAGGIGTSLPAMVGTALGAATIYLSGGTLSGVGAKLILSSISAGIAGFGAAGNATKEAYRASGKLDGSAFGYGALSGATEASLEFLTGLAGKGSGKVVDAFAKKLGKDTAKAVGKRTAMTVIKDISGDFISEAIEEGVAEFVSPYYKRMTYDPLAKNATKEEIGYAALVGGISGVIMSGSTSAVNTSVTHTSNLISGKKSYDNGAYKSIYEIGQKFADEEMKHDTGIGAYQASKQTYDKLTESLKKHNDISTDAELLDRIKQGNIEFKVNDLFLLGEMSKTNAASALYHEVKKYSERLIYDAENAAAKFSSFGMKDANGNPINITADQLLEGIDRDLLEKAKKNTLSSSERKKFVKSVRKAMTTNSTLVTLAAAEVAGEITMDTKRMAEAVLNGEQMATMADVSRLLAEGKSEEVEELGRALGISDWSTVSSSELAQKLASYNESGNISEWANQRKRVREAASIGIENTKQLPHILRKNMQDGTYRFASGDGNVDMAVIKEGESFYLYNYETGDISRSLTSKDVNSILKTYWTEGKVDTSSVEQDAVSKYAAKESELDTMAEKDIDDYKSLSAGSKASVRTTIRQAQAHGLSEEQTRLIATVAAKSGLNIEFDATMDKGEDGVLVGNTIYINPNNSEERTYEVILGHEMFHKLFANGGKRSLQLFIEAKDLIERSNPEKAQKVRERYKKFYKKRGTASSVAQAISEEEVAAAGAEEVFKSKEAWSYILSKEPSFADKVLSFFRKSAREYSSIQGLSAQARKFVRQYKALFESLSERNRDNNAFGGVDFEGAGAKKIPVTNTETDSMHVTGDNDEEAPAVTNTDVDTDTRFALPIGDETVDARSVSEQDVRTLLEQAKNGVYSPKTYLPLRVSTPQFIIDVVAEHSDGKVQVENLPMITDVEHLMQIMDEDDGRDYGNRRPHGLDIDDIIKILRKIGHPTYIVYQNNKRYAAAVSFYNKQSQKVIAVLDFAWQSEGKQHNFKQQIEMNGYNAGLYNVIVTTYKPDSFDSYLANNEIVYDKQKMNGKYQVDSGRIVAVVHDTPFINNSLSQLSEKSNPSDENSSKKPPKKRFALTDEAYLAAVESGDMETAQRMVDEAAKAAGYTERVFHGTRSGDFYVFDEERIGDNYGGYNAEGGAFDFTYDESRAWLWAGKARGTGKARVIKAFIKTEKPFYSYDGAIAKELFDLLPDNISEDEKKYAMSYGIPFKEVLEQHGIDFKKAITSKGFDSYKMYRGDFGNVGVYSPYQIKSADPVTYDAKGNVIPLSKRFNSENSDIRYAITDEAIENRKNRAIEEFGTTNDFARTGFVTNDGRMLNLSQYGLSGVQHRIIERVFDGVKGEEAIAQFIQEGNVRIKESSPGIEISADTALTQNQYNVVSRFISASLTKRGVFYLDITDAKGNEAASITYDNRDSSSGIIYDIKEYYKSGKIPEARWALTGDEDLKAIFGDIDMNADADGASFDIEAVLERGIPRKPGASALTIGEMKKTIANNTHYQVFSKGKALEVIGRMFGTSDLTAKTRAKLADALWQGFNDCTDVESRQTFAHDMAEFIVATMVTEAKVKNPDVMEAQERLSYLSAYIGKITFNPDDLSEIRHIADKAGLKKILGRWGYKGKKGTHRVPMDVFVVDIAREMPGMSELEDMHPVEAFMELDAMYERAREDVKDKWISAYWEATDADMLAIVAGIEADIMKAFETEGEQSKFSKLVESRIEYYSTRAEFWKAEHDRIKGRDRILGLLMSQAQKMKDLKLGTFANSTQHDSEIFKNSIEQLARIQFRGNLNVSGTRKILADLRQWYISDVVKTGILGYVDANSTGLYVQGVADMLEILSEGEKGFTKDDLKMLYDVMSYFTNFVENWGKVFRQGKWIEAKPEAERYINTLHDNESLKVGLFSKLAGTTYIQTFGDPMTVARRMDMYENGFYTEMMQELRDAAVDAQVAEMEIRSAYDEFTKNHKKYVEKASVDTVSYRGAEIPKMHLIGLYMTLRRKHAWAGLAANGFAFTDTKGKRVRVNGVVSPETKITNAELEQYTKEQLSAIEALLTDTDKEYIAILEQAFNVDARKLKADRDMQRLGFTNATNDYYYPIRRGNIAKNVDTADIAGELDRVSNSSFNKDTVRGAKQELFIESADAVFNRHIHAVCQYAYLSPAVEAYNSLYNLDISGNKNKPISVATESANTWDKGNKYFVKLISDIQGIPATSSEGMKVLGFIRGSYAKFQLGANPKVWLTQLSSIFASSSLLDADSITRGMAVSSKGMDEYCSLAKLRNNDNTAAMAQGVLDSKAKRAVGAISKFSDLLMSPIGKMDRFVVGRLFGACQVQVQKNSGAKIGTEANKIEAGKLLRRVILETQQNSVATERSAAMRSGNEIMRTLTMFTSDSMKVVGRVIDAVGEVATLKSKLKATTDADTRSALKRQLKAANRKVRKAVGALCLTAVFMASIAQLFRWLYDKEQDEDESVAETMLVDAVGNLFGGLPLFKDAYGKIFDGYDVNNYAYSAVNDLLDSALNLFEVAGNIFTKEGSVQERNRAVRNLAYSVGQMFGIPVRNVYNVFFGLTKRFNPEAAYMIDSALYEKNYQNELYKAIEQDDAEMTSFIMSLLLGERMNENVDEAVFNELLVLSKNGQKVIPRSVPSSITIDEVEYPLSVTEQAAVKDIYATSEKSLKALFAKSKYNTLSDEQKAAAIDFIYNTYYDKALEVTLGIDRGNNSLTIADMVGVDNMALLYVTTKGLTSDIDRHGNVINGSKRKKIIEQINTLNVTREEKILMIYAKGYTVQDNDIRGVNADSAKTLLLRYLNSATGLTTAQKKELASKCNLELRNGRFTLKS